MIIVVIGEGNTDCIIGHDEERDGALKVFAKRLLSKTIREFNSHELPGARLPRLTRRVSDDVHTEKVRMAIELYSCQHDVQGLIIGVDRDGERGKNRLRDMNTAVEQSAGERLGGETVVTVAIEEIESWLLADAAAIETVLGQSKEVSNPETLPNPKEILAGLIAHSNSIVEVAYDDIARVCDLDVVRRKCQSFDQFSECVKKVFSGK